MIRTHKLQIIRFNLLLAGAMVLVLVTTAFASSQAFAGSDGQNAPVVEEAQSANSVNLRPLAAAVGFDLCATTGTVSPGGASVPIWGFTLGSTCSAGDATLPGPELRVNAGDTVTITLHNNLSENVSILIPGQNVSASGGTAGLFTSEAVPGGTVTYSFIAQEGTYLYESGTDASIQVPMGLYGALIVNSGTGLAYGQAFDEEAVLLLSELDPNLNANPGGFDLLNYHPVYWLINGKAYPDTDPVSASPGDRVLLRYLNAGFDHPSMTLLGAYQRVIAKDSYALPNAFDVVAETIPAGTTTDMIVTTTVLDSKLPLYNRNMYVTNSDAFPGGMLTFIDLSGTPVDHPPTVNAGADQTIVLPASASLDGTVTDDGLSTLTTLWTMTSGPGTVTFGNASLVDTTASFSAAGDYVLRLTATDGTGSVSDDVAIAVKVDQPPTVNAGADQVVTLPASASLDGTVTDDGLSTLTTLWTTTSGPGTVTFANASLVDTTASFSVAGSYVLRLTATDGTLVQVFDEVAITVNPAPANPIHVGDLDNASNNPGNPNWNARVWVYIHNASHAPVVGALVSGTWTVGANSFAGSCTTDANGRCRMDRNLSDAIGSATFTVTNVSSAGATYQSSANHDPDGDSNGTTITVNRP